MPSPRGRSTASYGRFTGDSVRFPELVLRDEAADDARGLPERSQRPHQRAQPHLRARPPLPRLHGQQPASSAARDRSPASRSTGPTPPATRRAWSPSATEGTSGRRWPRPGGAIPPSILASSISSRPYLLLHSTDNPHERLDRALPLRHEAAATLRTGHGQGRWKTPRSTASTA